ncbi:MAG: hypothetical protein LJF06_13165 [Gemmatimonadetes bacterium]|nr:hypothetical protein [Gemmatimonadota bacterium]
MPRIAFDDLPDHGRLWVFPASRGLAPAEVSALLAWVDAYLGEWTAHGAPLRSGRELRAEHFLLVGVDEDAEAPSGCSIDALMNQLRDLGGTMGVTLIDHASVWYRDGDDAEIHRVSRPEFRRLARDGSVGPDTVVFDTTLTRLSQVRAGKLEVPARDAWHGRAFFGVAPAG